MTDGKRDRQRANRQARLAAEAASRRQQVRRRRMIVVGGIGLALAAAILVAAITGGDDEREVTSAGPTTTLDEPGPTTTVAAASTSAAGKPCVPVADDLPASAPAVPVKVGPPPTELVIEDLTVGTGAAVTENAAVTVNYIGVSCSTGKVFDSSYGGEPVSFPLTNVIAGWQDGLPGMRVGGQRLLGIPPAQGYGSRGQPPDIAPDETLWFVVEVLEAKPA